MRLSVVIDIITIFFVLFCILNFSYEKFNNSALPKSLLVQGYVKSNLVTYVVKNLERLIIVEHYVKEGENLWTIARDYGTTPDSIRSTNNLEGIFILPGQRLLVHNKKGMLYKNVGKNFINNFDELIKKYKKFNSNLNPDEIIEENDLSPALLVSKKLPQGEIFLPHTTLEFKHFIFPLTRWRLTSVIGMRFHPILKYYRYHEGWDFAQPYGTPVYASKDGMVIFTGWREGYGKTVIIKHPDGLKSVYAHLSNISIKEGKWVKRGQKIGNVGSTGLSTGPHLHFEIRDRFGRALNPRKYFYR